MAFVDYLTRIVQLRLLGKVCHHQRALTALERIFELIDTDEMIRGGTKTLTTEDHAIRYRNVSFRYRDEGPTILHNIELDIDPGEVVAIVGATGSGKTTLGRLLMRQYTGYDGTITIGGDAIESIALPDLRALISLFTKTPFCLTAPSKKTSNCESSVNEETLQRAAKAAKLSTLSQNGDNFLARKITERGENLSAGERQLVSIARALARPSPVVILDEATANVDSRTEQQIDDAIDALVEQKTMIIIAHRLSTITKADRIIVMRQGRVVEMGNHETLLNKGSYYANLVESGLKGTMKPSQLKVNNLMRWRLFIAILLFGGCHCGIDLDAPIVQPPKNERSQIHFSEPLEQQNDPTLPCESCHAEIVESYRKSAKAKTLGPIDPQIHNAMVHRKIDHLLYSLSLESTEPATVIATEP